MRDIVAWVLIGLLVISMTLGVPWVLFYATNLFFGFHIPYNFKTVIGFWFIVTILRGVFTSRTRA